MLVQSVNQLQGSDGRCMRTGELTETEMIEILEDLARNSRSATARIQAIKALREIRGGGEQKPSSDTVAQLYEVGKPLRTKAA